jgi:bifunctional aspartokinase / homoserine dehydrogenase 1
MKKPMRIMKFGGTSLGDSSCIKRVVEIIRTSSQECGVAVVVSAMSGVTNQLIEAANQSHAGNETAVRVVFNELRKRHDEVVATLIHSAEERRRLQRKLHNLFLDGERLCQGTILLHELTVRTVDAISGLGERLCAPIVAAVLSEVGVASEAIEATELIITDSYHGGAEPWIDLTRARCQARMVPLMQAGIVPVVTGFIGATEEGVLTTLGRGGSDYSATILGAALDADEVVIWTDVPGLLTADPRLVPDAVTITEISYREAAELAYFGAKVLHSKTLRPLTQRGIPVRIRNTFATDEPGTKITATGPPTSGGVKALTAISDASLITIAGQGTAGVPDALARTAAAAAAVRADVLLISQSSSHNDICMVIPSADAKRTVEALTHEFSQDLNHAKREDSVFDSAVSFITLVGQNLRATPGTVARAFAALGKESVDVIATSQGSSDCSMSFVVSQQDLKTALAGIHRELELGSMPLSSRPVADVANPTATWTFQSEQATAD